MKINKAVKLVAVCTTIAAGIGTAVYFIKDKADRKRLSEDFGDDFEDDFDDFEDFENHEGVAHNTCEKSGNAAREYVDLNHQTDITDESNE